MFIIIRQRMFVYKAGIWGAEVALVNGSTGKTIKTLNQQYPRKSLKNAMRASLKDALEVAREKGGTEFAYDTNYWEGARYAAYQNGVPLLGEDGDLLTPTSELGYFEEYEELEDGEEGVA
ncbi:hypothetical protein [Effusibacillus pohliae]|uniref:hypothetical protein n=1 Tax=Effusibacillus pohliae TaxID=232270 RepID=UPI000362258E|nr:hypothetical protein [Effusibacillus pohliae]